MNFALFALVIATAFFVGSLALLNFGRHLGLRYLQQQKGAGSMAGLTTVEGAVFALIGLLLAFTISGARCPSIMTDLLLRCFIGRGFSSRTFLPSMNGASAGLRRKS